MTLISICPYCGEQIEIYLENYPHDINLDELKFVCTGCHHSYTLKLKLVK